MTRACALWVWALTAACATSSSSTSGGDKGGLVSISRENTDKAFAPRKFALVIGISEFDDDSWRTLKYARKDALDVARALSDARLGHFDEVVVATTPEQTTRAGILAAVEAFKAKASRPDDIALVFISAHGTLARDDKGELRRYLVTRDAKLRSVHDSALSLDELKARFDELPSRRRLLVLATCHSGSGKSLLPPEVARELASIKAGFYARPLEESSRAAMVFSACDFGETAREDEGLGNDIYTFYFVEALGGAADRNQDGAVTATEAHDYARRRTYRYTEGRQRPSAEILEVGADPLVLSGEISREGQPELFSYSARLDGFTLKVDGEARTELPGGAAVKPGRRKVELTKGAAVLVSQDVDVQVGERLDVEDLLRRNEPWRTLSLSGGVGGFVDEKSRREVAAAAPSLQLTLRLEDLPMPRLSLVTDLSLSYGAQALQLDGGRVPFTHTSVTVGVAVPYRFRFGAVTLAVGPRVAGLYVARSFALERYSQMQRYVSVSPGLYGGGYLALSPRLELQLQSQLMLTYVVVDGRGQAAGFAGASLGAGYRF